jgi:GTP-binding protein EngB required for normal cell division
MSIAGSLHLREDSLLSILDEGSACLSESWPEGYPALKSLTSLRERLRDRRLQLAVLGQFKRGKSTFINALLGAAFLPAAVVPATAIATFIAWGSTPRVRVTYQDNRPAEDLYPADTSATREHLHELVTEDGNPMNRRRIARVDLFVPADVLRDGTILIDTPGVGSTLQHNTDTALQVLPECDAALFVVSADPPITEVEIAYLSKIQRHVVLLFFVLNKIDYLNLQERADALAFLRKTLHHTGQPDDLPQVFLLSARQALEAGNRGDAVALEASGLTQLEREVLTSLAREKTTALQASVRAKASTIIDQALSDLVLQIRALELPIEDLEQRSHSLEGALRDTQGERRVAQDLLEGDRRRAVAELESQAEQLRQDARRHFMGVVQRVIDENGGRVDRSAVQLALDAVVPAFFEDRLAEIASDFRKSVEAMLAGHQARADALVASVRETASTIFDVPLRATEVAEPFRLGPEPYWVTQRWSNLLIPSPATLLTRILPGNLRLARVRRQLEAQVAALVQQNVEGLRWATLRGLNDTFRRCSAQLDERLADVLATTQGMISMALERRRTEAGHSTAELDRLHALLERLSRIRADLASPVETYGART